MNIRRVRLPLSPDEARSLQLGELVMAEGEAAATVGLPTHLRIVKCLEEGVPTPFELHGQAFCHMGVCAEMSGDRLVPLYVNPTTSTRFVAHMAKMIRGLGLTTVIGKGGLDPASVEAMREVGCVYLSMVGGASSIHSDAVTEVMETAWDDLIPQFRLSRLRLEGLGPLTVAVDAHGNSVYEQLNTAARLKLPEILRNLAARR